jgi:hypothetical protein
MKKICYKNWLVALCTLLGFSSCGQQKLVVDGTTITFPKGVKPVSLEQWKQVRRVSYSYGDSSVAPDFHRSYDIIVDADSVKFAIFGYGVTVLKRTYPNTEAKFQQLVKNLMGCAIGKQKATGSNACTGGTTDRLGLSDAKGGTIFAGSFYNCDRGSGTLYIGDRKFYQVIKQAVPENVDSIVWSSKGRKSVLNPPTLIKK